MQVNITLPVLNEERLPRAVEQLTAFLRAVFGWPYEIVIADNGSTDGTWPVARQLEAKYPEVRTLCLAKRGPNRKPSTGNTDAKRGQLSCGNARSGRRAAALIGNDRVP